MQVNVTIRSEMLNVIDTSITTGTAPKKIIFQDASDITLAEMQFKELEAFGIDAQYKFKALDDSYSLKASVTTSGRVAKFFIKGEKVGGGVPLIVTMNGSVGGLNSNSDIRFNRRDWSESGVITLNNLILKLIQGLA